MNVIRQYLAGLLGLAALACGAPSLAADITGAGATFPFPIYAKWADAYKTKTGVGHELPVDRFRRRHQADRDKTVDFGASDMPLKPEESRQGGTDAISGRSSAASCRW